MVDLSVHWLGWGLDNQGLIPDISNERIFLSLLPYPDWFWGPQSLLTKGYWGFFPWGKSSWGAKLTTHLTLVPRLRMYLHSEYIFMAWCLIKKWIHLHGVLLHKAQGQCCPYISKHTVVNSVYSTVYYYFLEQTGGKNLISHFSDITFRRCGGWGRCSRVQTHAAFFRSFIILGTTNSRPFTCLPSFWFCFHLGVP